MAASNPISASSSTWTTPTMCSMKCWHEVREPRAAHGLSPASPPRSCDGEGSSTLRRWWHRPDGFFVPKKPRARRDRFAAYGL